MWFDYEFTPVHQIPEEVTGSIMVDECKVRGRVGVDVFFDQGFRIQEVSSIYKQSWLEIKMLKWSVVFYQQNMYPYREVF